MRRRDALTAAVAFLVARDVDAQSASPVVGYLSSRSPEVDAPLKKAFLRGLDEAGFTDGQNVVVDYIVGAADRLAALADELARRRVDAIFASSTSSAIAARQATASIPIVFTGASDPVKLGLAASLGRPGGNVTGVTMFAHTFGAKRLELLRDLVPDLRRTAVLVNPRNPSATDELADARAAARALGFSIVVVEVQGERDLASAFTAIRAENARAVYILDDPLFTVHRDKIATFCLSFSLPAISTLREFAAAGLLASFGPDFSDVHRQCGSYMARILRGEKPGDLPVMLPTKFAVVLNSATARELGVTLPPMLASVADEVIE